MFICEISHTHTLSDSSYESFECDPKLLLSARLVIPSKTVSTATQRRVENVQLTISDINNHT